MRTSILPLLFLLAACGPSEVEVTEAQRETTRSEGASTRAGEAPVDLGDGLILTVLERGGGEFVGVGGKVRVHYTADVVAVAEPEGDEAAEPEVEMEAQESATEPVQVETTETESESEATERESESEPEATETAESESVPTQTADSDVTEEAATEEASADAQDAPPAAQDAALPRRFDSSRARGVPDDWDLSRTARPRLIEGLRRGLVGLTAGSRVTLYIPASLAWGEEGLSAAKVPPRADLVYEIELLEVLP